MSHVKKNKKKGEKAEFRGLNPRHHDTNHGHPPLSLFFY